MGALAYRVRLVALLSAGALAVHQLRYLIAYGDQSHRVLVMHGHEYLSSVTQAVVVLVGLAIIGFLGHLFAIKRLPAAATEPAAPRADRLWLSGAIALTLVFFLQEFVEGQLEGANSSGLHGIFGHGGWIAVPLAIAIAGLVALLMRGAGTVIEHAIRRSCSSITTRPERSTRLFTIQRRVAADPVSGHLAGRGPPPLVL
jgi:hypothetical protein